MLGRGSYCHVSKAIIRNVDLDIPGAEATVAVKCLKPQTMGKMEDFQRTLKALLKQYFL
jgi:hypothetical protein